MFSLLQRLFNCYGYFVGEIDRHGIAYHFVNEKVLEKLGSTEQGLLCVGECVYNAVLLANCRELKKNTVRLIKKFLADGGKLAVAGAHPTYEEGVCTDFSWLKANVRSEDLPRPAVIGNVELDYTMRTLPGGKRFFFAVNEKDEPVFLDPLYEYWLGRVYFE